MTFNHILCLFIAANFSDIHSVYLFLYFPSFSACSILSSPFTPVCLLLDSLETSVPTITGAAFSHHSQVLSQPYKYLSLYCLFPTVYFMHVPDLPESCKHKYTLITSFLPKGRTQGICDLCV